MKGTFLYDPPAGTLLEAGAGQELSVLFVPKDTTNYNSVTKTVSINVIVTGLSDNLQTPVLHIYPIPVTDILMITPPDIIEPGLEMGYNICSIDGRIVHSSLEIYGGTAIPVNVKELPSGIYLLRFQADRISLIERFIKL